MKTRYSGSSLILSRCAAALFATLALLPPGARAGDTGHGHAMHAHDHAQHDHALPQGINRSVANYTLPDATLIGSHGKAVSLAAELDTRTPVLVNFIFTSCTAICPLTTAVFAQVQATLEARGKPFRLLSISIDPEQDTPARLREYAAKFGAGADWHFLTGDAASAQAVQRAFDAWRGGKMNHAPTTYLRVAPGAPWVRYDGLVDAETLVEEYQRLTTSLKTVQR
jgi:protein SCO1/2